MDLKSVDDIPEKWGEYFMIYDNYVNDSRIEHLMMTYYFNGISYQASAGGHYVAEQIFNFWTKNPRKNDPQIKIIKE
jgi:hypothetical protein